MTKLKLPLSVWLSEDGSGITPKVEYDTINSQLVGKVLPIDERTGIPIPHSYIVRTPREIEDHLTNKSVNKASLVYIIMAQPLKQNVPPFVLSIFGTDNKFNADHVLNRWEFVEAELTR